VTGDALVQTRLAEHAERGGELHLAVHPLFLDRRERLGEVHQEVLADGRCRDRL
jgi:hypothetical protein